MNRFINLEFGGEAEDQSLNETLGLARNEQYYLHEAETAFERGEFEKALRHYAKVLEFNPQNAFPWGAQVRMLIELEQYNDANAWADKALESFPNEPELLAAKAVALARNGDAKGALIFSDASIEEHAGSPQLWLARGDVLLARKEPRADYCFEKALMLARDDWLILWQATRIRLYHEQFAGALQLAQRAVARDAGHFVLWLEQGRCQEALGLTKAAKDSFARALELDRDCPAVTDALSRLRSKTVADRLRGWFRRLGK